MKILYWDGYDDMEDVNKSFGFERYTVEAGLVTPCIVFDKTKRRYLLGEYDAGRDACLQKPRQKAHEFIRGMNAVFRRNSSKHDS